MFSKEWLEPWEIILKLVPFWSGDMVCMCGETHGSKLKQCMYTVRLASHIDEVKWDTSVIFVALGYRLLNKAV